MMNIRTDRRPDATRGGPKKIFAVLSRSVTVRGKTIRHVLIFDDHPASVRLLLATAERVSLRGACQRVSSDNWPWDVLAFALTEHHLRRYPPSDSSPPSNAGVRKFQISEMSIFERLRK